MARFSATVTGDFDKLEKLVKTLRLLKSVSGDARRYAVTGLKRAVKKQFATGRDPYGNAWAQLAPSTRARKGRSKILVDTGRMRGSVDVTSIGATIGIIVQPPAGFHQSGTSRMPSRPILPIGVVPAEWEKILKDAVARALVRLMGKIMNL